MQLLTTEDAVIRTLTGRREYGEPAASTYQLAAGMNMVASSLRPTLEQLRDAGLIVELDAHLPEGVEETLGDRRWALTEATKENV